MFVSSTCSAFKKNLNVYGNSDQSLKLELHENTADWVYAKMLGTRSVSDFGFFSDLEICMQSEILTMGHKCRGKIPLSHTSYTNDLKVIS